MRVAFVTSTGQRIIDEDVDRPFHEAAFAARGVGLVHHAWDGDVDWPAFDLIVFRSPWDYAERMNEFTSWLDEAASVERFANPVPVVRWNLDKHYLAELADRGVPVVQVDFADDIDAFASALDRCDALEVVVKPAISAGSRLTGWFDRDDHGAVSLAEMILDEGGTVMIEPFVASVAERGETSVVQIDGETSHAFRKGPILARGGGFIDGRYDEQISAHQVSKEELDVVDSARAAISTITETNGWVGPGEQLLYARFDLVQRADGTPALLEAELFEPSLFLSVDPGAADRFADACLRRARIDR